MANKDNNMYRSSDDKFFAGVCAGMAHKLGFSKWGATICIHHWSFILRSDYSNLYYLLDGFKPRPTFNC